MKANEWKRVQNNSIVSCFEGHIDIFCLIIPEKKLSTSHILSLVILSSQLSTAEPLI